MNISNDSRINKPSIENFPPNAAYPDGEYLYFDSIRPEKILDMSNGSTDEPLDSPFHKLIDSIIKNKGDFSKIDPKVFSDLEDALAKSTGVPVDSERDTLLQQFFFFKAYPPSGVNKPLPSFDPKRLENISIKELIQFWQKPELQYPV